MNIRPRNSLAPGCIGRVRSHPSTAGAADDFSGFELRPSFDLRPSTLDLPRAFSLIEVMIACGIFFMATFAILALVSTTLRNARALQRGDVDAGMAAAQIFELMKTNRTTEVSGSGNFGENYPDYTFDFASHQYQSNGLLQVDIVVNRRGLRKPADVMSIWVYSPDAKSGPGQPTFR